MTSIYFKQFIAYHIIVIKSIIKSIIRKIYVAVGTSK